MKNKYNIITVVSAIVVCLIVIYLHLISHEMTGNIYLNQTDNIMIDVKKDFLKDTINNVFVDIDMLRESRYSDFKKNTEVFLKLIQDQMLLEDQEFIDSFISRFGDNLHKNMWLAILWNNETGEIYFNSLGMNIENIESIEDNKANIMSLMSTYATIEKDQIEGVFGGNKTYIDNLVKDEIGNIIRNRKFSNNSYIWVNEIVNYEGGDNYAIRRIHPNLQDTEGTYLSTEIEDIKGNKPYLQELEGVKENGEIFFNYYFKELNSSDISEKITYAKLYKDFDWIVAMGVHLDDLDDYTERINTEVSSLASESIIRLLGYILLVLLIGFSIIFIVVSKRISNATKSLKDEINADVLTNAYSRRYGEKTLYDLFKQYKVTGENPTIMMFDVDNLKLSNDKYGHGTGDKVLAEVVRAIKSLIRSSDRIIRWGGDEFICIFVGLRPEHINEFSQGLLKKISSLKIPVEDEIINITISMGFTCFKETDNDYKDALKRADKALYMSKEQGKNTINIIL